MYRAVVKNIAQVEAGVLYTVDIKHVYGGPCRKGRQAHILAYQQRLETACPYMEINYPFLVGYQRSSSDVQCRGVQEVQTNSTVVMAEVIHPSESGTVVAIPWNQTVRSFLVECMARGRRGRDASLLR